MKKKKKKNGADRRGSQTYDFMAEEPRYMVQVV